MLEAVALLTLFSGPCSFFLARQEVPHWHSVIITERGDPHPKGLSVVQETLPMFAFFFLSFFFCILLVGSPLPADWEKCPPPLCDASGFHRNFSWSVSLRSH